MRSFLMWTLATLALNALIAGFLTVIGIGGGYRENFIFSQCIGLSVFAACYATVHLAAPGRRRLLALVVGVPVAVVGGVALGMVLSGTGQQAARNAVLIGLIFGGGSTTLFYLQHRKGALEEALHAAQLQRVEAERRQIDAQLRSLQAQIEPHFLFNTLAHLSALIRSDPRQAERMLDALIHYLRATLARVRQDGSTFADELELLRAYLDILKLRMGHRLNYAFDVPQALLEHPFPPMLLQPLVENAVTHGLEPQVDGGEIAVSASGNADGSLRVSVSDTGAGLGNAALVSGVGLDNVRQRLRVLYGGAGQLEVRENARGGVIAVLTTGPLA